MSTLAGARGPLLPQASVVSVSAVEVLVLRNYDFSHLVDTPTQDLMHAYAKKFYFDDENSIRKTIHDQHEWEKYRRNLVSTRRGDTALASPRASPR